MFIRKWIAKKSMVQRSFPAGRKACFKIFWGAASEQTKSVNEDLQNSLLHNDSELQIHSPDTSCSEKNIPGQILKSLGLGRLRPAANSRCSTLAHNCKLLSPPTVYVAKTCAIVVLYSATELPNRRNSADKDVQIRARSYTRQTRDPRQPPEIVGTR